MANVGDYLLATIERVARRLIIAREPVILTGEVTSAAPLKIRIKQGYEISEEHLILDVRCSETWLKIPRNVKNGFEHKHEIEAKTELAKAGVEGQATESPTGHRHDIKISTKLALPEICLFSRPQNRRQGAHFAPIRRRVALCAGTDRLQNFKRQRQRQGGLWQRYLTARRRLILK